MKASPVQSHGIEHNSLYDVLSINAAKYPGRCAVIDCNEKITYQELLQRTNAFADHLANRGIVETDRVAHFGHSDVGYLISFLAAQRLGAIWVGINPKYSSREIAHVLRTSSPNCILSLVDEEEATQLKIAAHLYSSDISITQVSGKGIPLAPRDESLVSISRHAVEERPTSKNIASIVFTSGSTGTPKGACITQKGLVVAGKIYASKYAVRSAPFPRILCNLPINHVGMLCDLTATILVSAGTHVFMPSFIPQNIPKVIKKYGITHLGQVPTMWHAILDEFDKQGIDNQILEWGIWSGAALEHSNVERVRKFCTFAGTCYGMTETTGSVTFTREKDDATVLSSSIGFPVDPNNFRLYDKGNVTDVETPGEIQIKGDILFSGYWNEFEATNKSFIGEWFKTGDIACWQSDGSLRLVGRKKEMFKSGGYNVYPREIETVLDTLDSIKLVAVIGVPDQQFQEIGYAVYSAEEPIKSDVLRQICRKNLANYKVPKKFYWMKDIPLLPVGKVDKTRLKKMLLNGNHPSLIEC